MIELIDTFPDIAVHPAEYKRLLGYPRQRVLSGRARELAEWARGWYRANGRPWVYARQAGRLEISNGSILLDSAAFSSRRLQSTLQQSEAHAAILVAVSAGPEVEAEAQRLWREEKPDEYFFLEVFGSAVVEHLTTMTGARLCAWAEEHGMAVLPHYSPGYPDWDIQQQRALLELIQRAGQPPLPYPLEAMDSGMLRPKKSLLAVFGLTKQTERVRRLSDLVPCENCSFSPCQFRRAPYARSIARSEVPSAADETGDRSANPAAEPIEHESAAAVTAPALNPTAKYSVNVKALKRWADERLTLSAHEDGTVDALFRYEGSTCSNMGRTIRFEYHVKLGPRQEGYPIREQRCGPAPGDEGHRYMCRYMSNPEHLMVAIDHEKPLLGQRLDDVLSWVRPLAAPSCYCEPASRKHKWGLVLETIHYALVHREMNQASTARNARVAKA